MRRRAGPPAAMSAPFHVRAHFEPFQGFGETFPGDRNSGFGATRRRARSPAAPGAL